MRTIFKQVDKNTEYGKQNFVSTSHNQTSLYRTQSIRNLCLHQQILYCTVYVKLISIKNLQKIIGFYRYQGTNGPYSCNCRCTQRRKSVQLMSKIYSFLFLGWIFEIDKWLCSSCCVQYLRNIIYKLKVFFQSYLLMNIKYNK